MAVKVEDILVRMQALGYGTDTETPQIKMIDQIHRRIVNARRWRFNTEIDKSKALTVGNGELELQPLSETKRVDAVRIESGTAYYLLEHQETSLLRDFEFMYRENGTPEYWSVVGQKLHVWPVPDKAYTVTIDYVQNPTTLTAKTDTLLIPDSAADILVWGAIIPLAFRERDWDAHNFARQEYAELYAEMLAQYGMTDRQTSKHVQASGFYDPFDVEPDAWLA